MRQRRSEIKENIAPEEVTCHQSYTNVIVKEEILLPGITIKEEKDGDAILLENGNIRINHFPKVEYLEDFKPDISGQILEPGEICYSNEKLVEPGEIPDYKFNIKKEKTEPLIEGRQFRIKDCYVDLHRGLKENEIARCKKCRLKKKGGEISNFDPDSSNEDFSGLKLKHATDDDYTEADSNESDQHDFSQSIQDETSRGTSRKRLRSQQRNMVHLNQDDLSSYECPKCKKTFKENRYLKKHMKCCESQFNTHKCKLCHFTTNQRHEFLAHVESIYDKYKCDFCKADFTRKRYIEIHILKAHLGMIHSCYICRSMFNTKEELNAHQNSCRENKVYKCEDCEASFSTTTGLAKHKIWHTGKRPYQCEICSRGFITKPHLQRHLLTHEKEKPVFNCNLCNYNTYWKMTLWSHIRNVHQENPLQCHICKKILREYSLEIHLRVHTGEKPYECDICGKKFAQRVTLNNHLITHKERELYKCNECSRTFKHKQVLENHMVNCLETNSKFKKKPAKKGDLYGHTVGEKKGKMMIGCNLCDFTTTKKVYIVKHVRRVHLKEKPYQCNFCKKHFSRKDNLDIHKRSHTKEKPFSCDVCGKSFTEKKHVKRHYMSVHENDRQFECNVCKKKFSRKSCLKRHSLIHTDNKRFQCEVCGEKFRIFESLKSHERVHNGKPFQCDLCKRGFKKKSELREHFRVNNVIYDCECGKRYHIYKSYTHHLFMQHKKVA